MDDKQQYHQVAPAAGQLQQTVLSSQNPKLEELKYHKQKNQQDLTSSVQTFNGFFNENFAGYTFDYKQSDHPTAALFHFGLKAASVLIYFFAGIFVRNQWTIPELIILVGAVDFWATKNVTGRLLVGLRWWEEIDEASGQQLWVFETRVNENMNSKVNEGIFWVTLVTAILLWGFLGVINFLTINIFNLISISFQLVILMSNTYFFFMCSRVAKQRAKQLAKVLGAEAINKMLNQSVIWPMRPPKAS